MNFHTFIKFISPLNNHSIKINLLFNSTAMKIFTFILFIFFLIISPGCTKKEDYRTSSEKTEIDKKESPVKNNTESNTNNFSEGAASKNSSVESDEASDKTDYNNDIRKSYETLSDVKYNLKNIPKSAGYSGKIVASASWNDRNGFNILLVTETKEKDNSNSNDIDARLSKELYGYQYIAGNESSVQVWKIQDYVKDCNAALELFYVKGSLSVTDINNDGVGESTFMYVVDCLGDVSPMGLKLMMHEGKDKYAIRGNTVVGSQGGDMKIDSSFDSAPSGFLDYAKTQWKKYRKVN